MTLLFSYAILQLGENMNLNDVFAFGNKATVLIRLASARKINNTNYAADEPYTMLSNVNVVFQYKGSIVNIDRENAQTAGRLVSYKKDFPTQVAIQNVTLNEKISNLLFDRLNEESYISRLLTSAAKEITSDTILLDLSATDFFLLVDGVINNGFLWNSTTGAFSIINFDEGKDYRVFYREKIAAPSYRLASTHNAYFSLEIFSEGNKSGEPMNVYIRLPRCQLLVDKKTNMDSGNAVSNLIFSIIEDDNNYIVFE